MDFLLRPSLGHAYAASLAAAAGVIVSSSVGMIGGAARYGASQSVLVSSGSDAANLIAVVLLLAAMGLARRSLGALLLWPGSLFYLAYAYVPYLVGAPFTPLMFAYVLVFLASVYGLAGVLLAVDGPRVRERFTGAHARTVGGILAAVGILAYAGLVVTALGALGSPATEAAWRGHWVADWVLRTPVLVLGGIMLWARRPFGYVAAPGLLLVSALGGVVFAVAAVLDNSAGGPVTDGSVVVVHLVISAASLAVLVWHLTVLASARRRVHGQAITPRAAP